MSQEHQYDVIVVGTGASGLSAALKAKSLGASVLVAEKGDAAAIAAVTARLEHRNADVREAAASALVQIAPGDAAAIAAVSARLEHADWAVRLSAVSALGAVAPPGDAAAIAAVSARLEDVQAEVRYPFSYFQIFSTISIFCIFYIIWISSA